MNIPRVRWTALIILVVFGVVFVQGNFDFLYVVKSGVVFLAVILGALLTALKYLQESWRIAEDELLHTMNRDAKPPSIWKRVL